MRLWLLRPIEENSEAWSPWYNKSFGFVIRAKTEERAREIANNAGGDETGKINNDIYRVGGDLWLDSKQSTCIKLNNIGEEELIIRDFASA